MSHTGDGSAPRRSAGGIWAGRNGDRVWVGEYDRGWRICVAGSWTDGFYASEETARRALELSASELKSLYPIWTREGENRPVSWDDLDRLERGRRARPLWGFVCGVAVPALIGLGVTAVAMLPVWSDVPFLVIGAVVLFGGGWLSGQYLREVQHRRAGPLRPGAERRVWAALKPRVAVGLAQRAGVPAEVAVAVLVVAVAVMVGGIAAAVLSG